MTDLRSVIGYLATVAESDRERSRHVGEVVWSPPQIPAAEHPIHELAAADLLHADEHLVWQGRLWICGEIDGVEYRWPIVRRRVSLGGRVTRRLGSVRPRPQTPFQITPGLVDSQLLHELALADDVWSDEIQWSVPSELLPGIERERTTRLGRLSTFLGRYLAVAGLGTLSIDEGKRPPEGDDPVVALCDGYYLDRNPYELNRASTLKLWTSRVGLDDTVLAALYGTAPDDGTPEVAAAAASTPDATGPQSGVGGASRPAGPTDHLDTPLPLNGRQRAAVASSRHAPITVVSGPPGTGKSHVVAAAAIAHVAAGRSVLITSRSVHACDVVHELLQRYPMVEALRFGDEQSARRVGDILAAGVPAADGRHDPSTLRDRCEALEAEIAEHRTRLIRRIDELAGFDRALVRRHDAPLWLAQRDLERIDLAAVTEAADQLLADGLLGWWHRRRARAVLDDQLGRHDLGADDLAEIVDIVAADQLVAAIAGRSLGLDDLWFELDRLEERWRSTIGDLLEAQRRDRAGRGHRSDLSELASALRMGPVKRREALSGLGGRFLEVVPLWIGTLADIEAVLPVEAGLFDLVILDEASQISQMSAVPALARARRAMVVGDSRQLRHVSFVSDELQRSAAAAHDLSPSLAARLDDRTNSLFDAATAVAATIELDEHFRSAPHIIGFSDRRFYGNRLRLMTQHPRNEARDAIDVVQVDGERNERRVVQAEVDAVIDVVRGLIDQGETSIGVVSPFRAQAEAIETAVLDRFRIDEIAAAQLRIGTVHGFQGSERDHVVLSIGVGPDDRRALRFVEDPAVFNVMITRARRHVTVVTSLDGASAGNGLFAEYLRHAAEPPLARRERLDASGWTARIADDLAGLTDRRIIAGYEVAGEELDLVIGDDDAAIGIETEIHPEGAERHIERRLALARAGWTIESMHRATCYGREEEAIAGLAARAATARSVDPNG